MSSVVKPECPATPQGTGQTEVGTARRAVAEAEAALRAAQSRAVDADADLQRARAARATCAEERRHLLNSSADLALLRKADRLMEDDRRVEELAASAVERANRELQRAEAGLQESQERLRATLDLVPQIRQAITDVGRDLVRLRHELWARERVVAETREIITEREAALTRLVARLESLTGERQA